MSSSQSPLILPRSIEFEETLATSLPTDWQQIANANSGDYGFVVDIETGLLRVENSLGLREYLEGGEYDEQLDQIDELD